MTPMAVAGANGSPRAPFRLSCRAMEGQVNAGCRFNDEGSTTRQNMEREKVVMLVILIF